MSDRISVSREINAPASTVYAMVADLTRMGEWSPENTGAKWLGNATTAKPGAKFQGTNKNGSKVWKTVGIVTAADADRLVEFQVKAGPLKVADWRYEIESVGDGCRVTESFTDLRGGLIKFIGSRVTGVADRDAHNRAGMEKTLENLKAAAEA